MKKTKKKMSPSRKRYAEWHPTISARLPLETRQKLVTNLKTMNISLADAFKILAGELEVKAKPVEDARREGFHQGLQRGRERYMVTYRCAKCGKLMIVESTAEKAAINNYMSEAGWGHANCDQG